jgi:DNA (cytosine-5)-methyltransferase 1
VSGANRPTKTTAIDLFCGAGGVTTGYKAAGIHVIAAVDNDPNARKSYALNHPEVKLFEDDIHELDPTILMARLRIRPGELGILTACAPCQSFSTLSKVRKRSDRRPRLVERIAEFVEQLQPAAVVVENVPQVERSWHFRRLVRRVRSAGYGAWHGVVNAAELGVPQRRRRLVLIALRGVADADVPRLVDSADPVRHLAETRTVRQAFAELKFVDADPLDRVRENYPPKVLQRIKAVPKDGGDRKNLPKRLQLNCHKNLKESGASSSYGRMWWDDLAPTLTTRCTTPACGRFTHPEEDRAITLREAAMLQTFPSTYRFEGGSMTIQAQIGNAVPPRMAQAIGLIVDDAIRQHRPAARTRPPSASSRETRSRMQSVGRRDTPAELAVRTRLHRMGLRFRVDHPPLGGVRRRADILFTKARVAVYVDGCFWHGCAEHGTWPKANGDYWRAKIERNQRRDLSTDRLLRERGWAVVRAWSHEDADEVARRVARIVRAAARTGTGRTQPLTPTRKRTAAAG